MGIELLGRSFVYGKYKYENQASKWSDFYRVKDGRVDFISIDRELFSESDIDSKYFKLF